MLLGVNIDNIIVQKTLAINTYSEANLYGVSTKLLYAYGIARIFRMRV